MEATASTRYDIYVNIHKAMRAFMTDTLTAVGRMDPDDGEDVAATLEQVRSLLGACLDHLDHENRFVHPAMEARRRGSSARVATDHAEHIDHIRELHRAVHTVENAAGQARSAAARNLYQQLALFVADNLDHMHVEETAHNRVLWTDYSDQELQALEGAIVASIPPQETMLTMRWMLPNISHAERVAMLAGMRAVAPREAFDGVLVLARSYLSEKDWSKLTHALELSEDAAAA